MPGLFNFFGDNNENLKNTKTEDSGSLQLRKEELDINKSRIQKGEVEISKEIIEDHKTVDVPVTHEEVVIERTPINNEATDTPITAGETIRIPVSEEQVNVGKHTVITEEISARKREVEETKVVDETLKREEARINKNGDAAIVNDASDDNFF
jgi:uncharacterized protein (TIGR02271 family)